MCEGALRNPSSWLRDLAYREIFSWEAVPRKASTRHAQTASEQLGGASTPAGLGVTSAVHRGRASKGPFLLRMAQCWCE